MAKILPLQTTQLQIVACLFLANKHPFAVLHRLVYICCKATQKTEGIQRLPTKYKLRINLKEKRGRHRKELNEDEKIWLIEFLNQRDITYTSLGCKDHVYIGKFNGERKYKQGQYLPWPLRVIF